MPGKPGHIRIAARAFRANRRLLAASSGAPGCPGAPSIIILSTPTLAVSGLSERTGFWCLGLSEIIHPC